MGRDARRERVARLLAPLLDQGEEITGNGGAWYARVGERPRLLFLGRHYQLVALTDRRLFVFPRRARARRIAALFASPIDDITVVRRRRWWLHQVIVRNREGQTALLEFRRRERSLAHSLVTTRG